MVVQLEGGKKPKAQKHYPQRIAGPTEATEHPKDVLESELFLPEPKPCYIALTELLTGSRLLHFLLVLRSSQATTTPPVPVPGSPPLLILLCFKLNRTFASHIFS